MPHQLAHGHGPLFLRKLGDVGLNLVIELQPALLQQQADRGRREHRGGGPDPEPRLRRDGHAVVEIRPAKTFGPHDLAANADRHREPRQVLFREGRARRFPPASHRIGPLWRRGRLRRRRHALRIRVNGRRRGGHVEMEPRDRCEQAADAHCNQCEPGLDPVPTLRHVPSAVRRCPRRGPGSRDVRPVFLSIEMAWSDAAGRGSRGTVTCGRIAQRPRQVFTDA